MINLPGLLKAMLEHRASDLHVTSGNPPCFRVDGQVVRTKLKSLSPVDTKELCYSVLTDSQKAQLEKDRQLDFSFGIRDLARFRGNIYFQRGALAAAFRHIPFEVPKLTSLGLSQQIMNLTRKPRGLILVTGSTGSGKSTTLAAMVDYLNEHDSLHIITIEDPIEYIHSHKSSLVNQREVGSDATDFALAMRAAMREDPDVVMVGEMRDRETIETALALAETGHLVLSTLHTNGAFQTINRIVQVFPADQQDQIRLQLSMVLEGVVSQCLLERMDKPGRALALEVMLPNPSIRNLIRDNKLFQIQSAMMMGQDQSGMITLNQSLFDLVKRRIINPENALLASPDPEDLIKHIADFQRKAAS